jgi:protoheme ferro-lyase
MMRQRQENDAQTTGIIMVGHGEPEVFDGAVWAEGLNEMFDEMRATGLEVPPEEAIPLMLPHIQEKYDAMGGRSPHVAICRKQCELVARQLPGYAVRIGFNEFSAPAFTGVADDFAAEGVRKLLFVPMLQTDSSHTAEIRKKIEAMKLTERNITWVMARPLFYRPEPTRLLVEMIARATGTTDPEEVGVVLASHGEPDRWTELSLDNTRCKEQETAFCACIKKGLVERGFVWDSILQGFNEFTHPELSEVVTKLISKNIKKLIVASSFGTTDGIHVNYDIPSKVKSAVPNPEVEIVCLNGWNDDPLLITAYVELVREALDRL